VIPFESIRRIFFWRKSSGSRLTNLNLARTIIRQSMGMGFAWPDADFQKPKVEWKRIVHRFPDWEAD
jgi:hypothetical protein